jgi:hypothetical protein
LKKPLVDAMEGENRFESAAYTAVREHFESIFNAAARRQRLFQQPASRARHGKTDAHMRKRTVLKRRRDELVRRNQRLRRLAAAPPALTRPHANAAAPR